MNPKIIKISENVWRTAAKNHKQKIKQLLQPGLLPMGDQSISKRRGRDNNNNKSHDDWTALDPVNPVYNFLIEYYGIKGAKGPRRLSKWAPDPKLLLDSESETSLKSGNLNDIDEVYEACMKASKGLGGILLENANLGDIGKTLHLRGCSPVLVDGSISDKNNLDLYGVLYNPAVFYDRQSEFKDDGERQKMLKTIAPFQWYSSILQTTLDSEPIIHCHGLHEWAMQYHPEGAPPPPSAKYQKSLKLRVSRETINKTVERKGISCTHVDALRFFAPAAGPLNHHGSSLERMDQLRLEQRACVHAHMDLLKIGLKLTPFVDSNLMVKILQIALKARRLDVEASPYDCSFYTGTEGVHVETPEGRKLYRKRQVELMEEAEPIRIRLLDAYDSFMRIAFDDELLSGGKSSSTSNKYVAPERHARATPGGLPWRKNLIEN